MQKQELVHFEMYQLLFSECARLNSSYSIELLSDALCCDTGTGLYKFVLFMISELHRIQGAF